MAQKIISSTTLTAWADAIREKEGSIGSIKVSEMAQRILDLASGGGEFYGCPIETGTVVIPASAAFQATIAHNLGTVKGIIANCKINVKGETYTRNQYIIEIVDEFLVWYHYDASGKQIISNVSFISTNATNSLQVFQMFGITEATEMDYILLGA